LAALAVAVPAFGQNLLTNGGFDTDLSGWTYGKASWGADIPMVHNGTGPGQPTARPGYAGTGGWGGTPDGNRWIYQTVTGLTVGQTYTLSADIAVMYGAAQAVNGSCWWQLGQEPGAYDAGNMDSGSTATLVANISSPAGGLQTDWVPYSGTFTATDTSATIFLKYGGNGTNWQYYGAYLDNVSLTPEPASLALLALGLPLLRRRRR
jgi:MYXO-CTERM domain-containing protein